MNELFVSGDTLFEICDKQNIPISEASLRREILISKKSKKEIQDQLKHA